MLSGQTHYLFQSLLVIGHYTSIQFTQVCSRVASLSPSDQLMWKSDTWKRELAKSDQQN